MPIFNDTKVAFADKSDAQLRKAYWMFKMIEQPALTSLGTSVLNFTVHNNFPFVTGIVKNTLFEQFCGGETREESMKVVKQLFKRGVGSIFDYSIEGKEDEETFDAVCKEIKDIVRFSVGNPAIPFIVFKPTAFGRIDLYEAVGKGAELTTSQKEEWERVVRRFDEVCKLCHENDKKVMVDAEETWMQDAADHLCEEMMEKYNQEKPIVWNTIQMYRTGRLEYMEANLQRAREKNYFIGYKIVRGAYMEKERARAAEKGYADPIQPTKEASDKNYNAGIDFVMNHLDKVSAFFGTHNEISSELIMDKMKAKSLENDNPHVYFGQLYGMSDNITFYLSDKGYNG
jgi:proline dehydrogenase